MAEDLQHSAFLDRRRRQLRGRLADVRRRVGYDMSPAMRDFGERLPSLMPWFMAEITRPPHTFLHGDLRLDQLFFAVGTDDAPVTALDWQITAKGRGAYDLGYFLSQSLTAETRRSCEDAAARRYAERLAEHGIDYPREELRRDYRLTTAWCFIYPVIGRGPDRHRQRPPIEAAAHHVHRLRDGDRGPRRACH